MTRRVDYRDELDVPGEMGWDRAEAIAEQEAKQAARKLEQVKFLRAQERRVAGLETRLQELETQGQEREAAIASRESQAQQAFDRDMARRGEEIARRDAVIAEKVAREAELDQRLAAKAADYRRWLESQPQPVPVHT